MAIPGNAGGSASGDWWAVTYQALSNVASRLAVNPVPQVIYLQAASSAAADAAAQAQLGQGVTITSTLGPYPSKAAAQAQASSNNAAIAKAEQSGSFPNPLAAIASFFARLTEGSLWIRVAEVLLGLGLIAVGVAKLTNAVPIATKIAEVVK